MSDRVYYRLDQFQYTSSTACLCTLHSSGVTYTESIQYSLSIFLYIMDTIQFVSVHSTGDPAAIFLW